MARGDRRSPRARVRPDLVARLRQHRIARGLCGPPRGTRARRERRRRGQPVDAILPLSLGFTAGGQHLIYIAQRGAQPRVVVDGAEGPPLDAVDPPVFAPRGDRWAAVATLQGARFLLTDRGPGHTYTWVGSPTWSADGSTIGYLARRGARVSSSTATASPRSMEPWRARSCSASEGAGPPSRPTPPPAASTSSSMVSPRALRHGRADCRGRAPPCRRAAPRKRERNFPAMGARRAAKK